MVQAIVVADTNYDEKSNDGRGTDQSKHSSRSYTLEEALQETRIGKCQYILTFLTGISVLGSTIENTNISYILPYAKCDLNLSTEEQGLLSGISYLGIVFTSHAWGFLADTWGRQKVLHASAVGAFICSFLSAFAMDTITLIVLRFLAGAFAAGASSGGYSYISEFHTVATAARSAAFVSIALSAFWVFMSPLAIAIVPMDWSFYIFTLEYKPWRFFLTCTTIINLISAIVFTFMPETPKFLAAVGRKEEAVKVLSRMYAINTGEPKEKYPVKSIENVTIGNNLSDAKGICDFLSLVIEQTKPVLQKPLFTNTWKLCYIILVMFSIGHGTFMWFPDFLMQLQRYEGIPKTLCEIVGPKAVVSSSAYV
ncbi:synaptic vesicle glycoprotein 2C-like [Sitodiplosis mosellana]|uniref:synaptic vesicle glycoprotein 2C-like n=1 Tax=Sitodiplosis mosellana TaxID=263140 RepID=UPI0024437D69|nr:synaptic vesicle glycoprotein 2C-like [Sitodiplosis mosellana]